MKFRRWAGIIALASVFCTLSLTSGNAVQPAQAESEMYSCSDTEKANKEIEEMSGLKFSDAVDPISWLNKRQSFCVTIDIGDTGRPVVIGNVPNIQQLIVNDVTSLALSSGYQMSPDKKTTKRIDEQKPFNVAFKEGMPNPVYYGETPIVTIAIGDMIVEDNIFSTIKQKVGTIFGGSITSPPSKKDIEASLRYINPKDYQTKLRTISTIIKDRKSDILGWGEGQCLIDAEDCSANGSYLFANALLNDLVDLPESQIRVELAKRTGKHFQEVQMSIASLLDIKGTQIERSMPIDINSLIKADRDLLNGIEDQRAETRAVGSPSYYIATVFMTVSTWFADWSESMLSFINWDWVEDSGIMKILDSAVVKLILAIIAAMFIIRIGMMIYKVAAGESNVAAWMGILGSFLMFMFVAAAAISPSWLQGVGKHTISMSNTLSSEISSKIVLSNAGSLKDVCGPNPSPKCLNRLPMLDTWSNYQFGKGIQSDEMTMTQTQVNELIPPMVNGSPIPNWGYYGASMMERNSTNVYRTVDQLVAPKLNILESGKLDKNNPYTNNTSEANIQNAAGLGAGMLSNLLVIQVWVLSLFQLLAFIELIVIMALFILMALRGWIDQDIPQPFKLFGMALVRNIVWPVISAFIISTMMNASAEGPMIILATQVILFSVIFLAWKPIMRSKMIPMSGLADTKMGRNMANKMKQGRRKLVNNMRARFKK